MRVKATIENPSPQGREGRKGKLKDRLRLVCGDWHFRIDKCYCLF